MLLVVLIHANGQYVGGVVGQSGLFITFVYHPVGGKVGPSKDSVVTIVDDVNIPGEYVELVAVEPSEPESLYH